MKFCLIVNPAPYLMEFFGKLAYKIIERGDEVVIVFSGKFSEYDKKHFFPKEVKFISRVDWSLQNYNPQRRDFDNISWAEFFPSFARREGFSIAFKDAFDFISQGYQFFEYIFEQEKPDAILFEPPSGYSSKIAYHLAEKYKVPYLGIVTSRLDNKLDLYDSYWTDSRFESTFRNLNYKDISQKERKFAKDFTERFISHTYVPNYMGISKIFFSPFGFVTHYVKRIKERAGLMLLFWQNRKRFLGHDFEGEIIFWNRVKAPFGMFKRQVRIFLQKNIYGKLNKDDKFFLYPLHVSSESTTVVLACYHSDQLNSIKQMAFALPFPMKLYVKEHPNAIGARSMNFYKTLKRIPNVVLISPGENLQNLIKRSFGVIALTSTVGMEAALAGKPAYVMGDVFYIHHPMCRKIRDFPDLKKRVAEDLKRGSDIVDSELEKINVRFLISYMRNTLSASILAASWAKDTNDYGKIYEAFKKIVHERKAGVKPDIGKKIGESKNKCPVCKNDSIPIFCQKHENEQGKFTLYECNECLVQFWMPLKHPGAQWYEEGGANQISQVVSSKITRGYHKAFLDKHTSALKNKTILDVGCGTGEFLSAVEDKGGKVWGVDLSNVAIATAKENFSLKNIYVMSFDKFFKQVNLPKFDIITCFEVIEHVDDPLLLLKRMQEHLKPGGKIVVTAPSRDRFGVNMNSWDFPPNHLTRWNEEAMRKLSRLAKLDVMNMSAVESFHIILSSMNTKFRFGLVGKVARMSKQGNLSNALPKSAVLLGVIKDYLIGSVPAMIVWSWGSIVGRRNGILLFELKKRHG